MEDVEIVIGLLTSWNSERGFGFVTLPIKTFPIKKYFLHISEILEGENPPSVGSMVRFEVGPAGPGAKFFSARKALVVAPKDVTKAVTL